ncbi:UNVERIFIED_CONTAM: LytTR family two component transcriptional regulator [Acetivibrio alkalicellulosi]
MLLKVILCDSDEGNINYLKHEIQRIADKNHFHIKIVLVAYSPEKVLNYISKEEGINSYFIEVVYNLSDIDGIDLAKHIRDNDRESYIVFCTANTEFILRAMTGLIRPAGYLIKKCDAKKLKSIEGLEIVVGDIYRDYLNSVSEDIDILNINIGAEIFRINYDEIVYVEAFQKKVYVYTSNQRIGYYDSLTSLEKRLSENFFRCHKGYIINVEKVKKVSFSDMTIYMENGSEILVSRKYRDALKDKLSAWTKKQVKS